MVYCTYFCSSTFCYFFTGTYAYGAWLANFRNGYMFGNSGVDTNDCYVRLSATF